MKLLDLLVLSFILGVTFSIGYVFTTASMILLYSFIYAALDSINFD
jgi:hypothetical protein